MSVANGWKLVFALQMSLINVVKLCPFKQPLFQINEIGTIIHYVLEKLKPLFTDNNTASKAEVDDLETVINQHVETYLNEHGLTSGA